MGWLGPMSCGSSDPLNGSLGGSRPIFSIVAELITNNVALLGTRGLRFQGANVEKDWLTALLWLNESKAAIVVPMG